jgi:hypothetical protein
MTLRHGGYGRHSEAPMLQERKMAMTEYVEALENCRLATDEVCNLYYALADIAEEFHELLEDYGGEEKGKANIVALNPFQPITQRWADCLAARRLVVRDLEAIVEYCLAQKPRTADHRLAIKLTAPVLKKVKATLAVLESLPPPPSDGGGGGGERRAA